MKFVLVIAVVSLKVSRLELLQGLVSLQVGVLTVLLMLSLVVLAESHLVLMMDLN